MEIIPPKLINTNDGACFLFTNNFERSPTTYCLHTLVQLHNNIRMKRNAYEDSMYVVCKRFNLFIEHYTFCMSGWLKQRHYIHACVVSNEKVWVCYLAALTHSHIQYIFTHKTREVITITKYFRMCAWLSMAIWMYGRHSKTLKAINNLLLKTFLNDIHEVPILQQMISFCQFGSRSECVNFKHLLESATCWFKNGLSARKTSTKSVREFKFLLKTVFHMDDIIF